MDPNKKEELIKKLAARQADVQGRVALVSKGLQEIELMRLKTVTANTLFEYSEHIKKFERDKTELISSREFKQVFKDQSCSQLIKE